MVHHCCNPLYLGEASPALLTGILDSLYITAWCAPTLLLPTPIAFLQSFLCSNRFTFLSLRHCQIPFFQLQAFPIMELHHHSCILPSNAPALPEPEPYIPSRVLQERSANRLHEYSDGISPRKHSPIYADRLGGHFTGNIPTYFSSDKTEAQIELETKRLMKRLKKCEKYQKYRERQPSSLSNDKNDKKEQRWPDHLEEAFFRGKF